METKQRNAGIDLLRCISMFMIVMLHVLGGSGLLESESGVISGMAWLIQAVVVCGVNCFGLISGYVGFNEEGNRYKPGKYLQLWTEVVFFLLSINLFSILVFPETVDAAGIVKSFLPVTFNIYWYFTAYTGVYMLKPWINDFIRKTEKRTLNRLVLVVFVLFSVYGGTISVVSDSFSMGYGYSFIWLFVLYILGAWVKKTDFLSDIKTYKLTLVIFFCILVSWISKILLPSQLNTPLGGVLADEIFMSYVSPVTLVEAIAYLCLFRRIKLGKFKDPVIKISGYTFGIYLIHTHPVIYFSIFLKLDSVFADSGFMAFSLLLGMSVGVFIVCLIAEIVRANIFKLFKINVFAVKCESVIIKVIKRIIKE